MKGTRSPGKCGKTAAETQQMREVEELVLMKPGQVDRVDWVLYPHTHTLQANKHISDQQPAEEELLPSPSCYEELRSLPV